MHTDTSWDTMGVIERVDMINFMCHRNLSISLGPRINFIIGHNGSGKSAILTAITVALGGKANTTSRGSSLKDFIREGASAAEVRVHLRNHGTDAFRHDIYGDRITIERRIHADGGGSWKIRTSAGRVVSTKREELDAICDHANIQVDNPMNILSQDAARQFLGSSHAEDKYSFFLRGTQLTQLAQEYELIQTNIQRMKRAMALSEDVLPDLEREAREANARWQQVEQARVEQEKLDALKEELVWSQVIAKEKELGALAEQLETARAKVAAMEKKRDEEAQRATGLDETVAELETRNREQNEREVQLQQQRAEILHELRDRKAALSALKTQERDLNEQADRVQRMIRQLQSQIDNEARRQAQDRRAIREAQEAERDALQRERLDLEMRQVTLGQASETLAEQRQAHVAERAKIMAEKQSLEEKQAHLRSFLRRCEEASANRSTAFGGASIPRVLAAIERETHWHSKPVGPLGMHIRLHDARWAPLIESVLNDSLNAFLVTNHEDRARLARILRECRASNQIITAARDLFDYTSGEPDPSITTILRVLDTDEHILRVLIDAHRIEKSALVHQRVQGDELMRQRWANVQQCYSADLFRITGGPTGSSTQTVTSYTGVPRLVSDARAEMDEARQAMSANDVKLQHVATSLTAWQRQEATWQADERAHQQAQDEAKQALREVRYRMAAVEDRMREEEPANVAALEEAKADAEEEMAHIVDRFKDIESQKEAAEEALSAPTTKHAQLQEQIQLVEGHKQSTEASLQATYTERVRLQKNKEYWARQIETQQAQMHEDESKERSLAALIDVRMAYTYLESWTVMATEYCARVETQRTPASLEEQIRTIEAHMEAVQAHTGLSVDEIVRDLRAKNKAFHDAKQQLEHTRTTIHVLDHAIQLRLEKWHYFRRFVAIRARANFALHLQQRGFAGSLHFDHNAQTLKLRVHTGDASQYGKDPKALSGGEKSFATICLLLSLWEAIGCPIRCLDEFDVFMDAVNRKVSMKMIVRRTVSLTSRSTLRVPLQACSTFSSRRRIWALYPWDRTYLTISHAGRCKFTVCRTQSDVPNYFTLRVCATSQSPAVS